MWYFAWLDGDNRCLFFETKEERAHWVAKGPGRDMIAYSDPRAIKVRESKFFEHCDRVRRLREQVRAELGGSGRGIGAVPNAAEAAGGRQMGTLETIKNKIQDGDTAYKTLSRIADPARLCRWCTDRVLHDQRPATPRIVLAAAKECAETGYPGRLLLSMLTETRPTCGPEAAASVDAIVRR